MEARNDDSQECLRIDSFKSDGVLGLIGQER